MRPMVRRLHLARPPRRLLRAPGAIVSIAIVSIAIVRIAIVSMKFPRSRGLSKAISTAKVVPEGSDAHADADADADAELGAMADSRARVAAPWGSPLKVRQAVAVCNGGL